MLYSHSRLDTFESCRLKFKYQYIIKPDVPRRQSVEAFLGTRAHEALELLYKHKMMGREWPRDEFLKFYSEDWERNKTDALFIVKKEYSLEDYFQQGLRALEDYWKRYYPFDQEKTIALEQRIFLYLDDGKQYKLQGIIDRISKTADGVWQIRDYKTKRSLPTQAEADSDRQLGLYQIGLRNAWNDADKVELIWHYLLFDEEIRSRREPNELEKLKIDTIHLVQEVEKASEENNFPYSESALCDWCDYFDICPAKKHLAKVRQLPPKEFKEDDGVRLADRYAQLLDRRAEIRMELNRVEEEMEEMKEEIYRYAESFLIEKIYGSEIYLKVSVQDSLKPPSREIKEEKILRDEMEQLLKNSGIWDEVSQLNSQRLIKLFTAGAMPQFVRERLGSYLTPEVTKRLYTGHLKEYDENFEKPD